MYPIARKNGSSCLLNLRRSSIAMFVCAPSSSLSSAKSGDEEEGGLKLFFRQSFFGSSFFSCFHLIPSPIGIRKRKFGQLPDWLAPRLRIGSRVVVNLSMADRGVAMLAKPLRHRHRKRFGFAKMNRQRPHTKVVRTLAGHQTGSRRITDGDLTVSVFEQQPTFSKSIHIRRDRQIVSVASHRWLQVINSDEQNIWVDLTWSACLDCPTASFWAIDSPTRKLRATSTEGETSKLQIYCSLLIRSTVYASHAAV